MIADSTKYVVTWKLDGRHHKECKTFAGAECQVDIVLVQGGDDVRVWSREEFLSAHSRPTPMSMSMCKQLMRVFGGARS